MSIRKLLKYSPFFICMLANMVAASARAEGGTSGGGGDAATEMRIDEIRADILTWINEGRAEALRLPSGISLKDYVNQMSEKLGFHDEMINGVNRKVHNVVIGSVTTKEEEDSTDPEQKVSVDRQHKTCRGFTSQRDGLPHILCNVERFATTPAPEQYRLIHHEYAGLAGLEQNVGASSDYEISNQITKQGDFQLVWRLSVKKSQPKDSPSDGTATDRAFYALAGNYIKISGTGNCPQSMIITAAEGGSYFKATLKVRQITGSAQFDDDAMTQDVSEVGYDWSKFYSAYVKHRLVTYLNRSNGYVIHENTELLSDYPGIFRWVQTPMWDRTSLFLKKNDDGILQFAKQIDGKGTDLGWAPIARFNCFYKAE